MIDYESQFTILGECEMCPYRSVHKNNIDTLIISEGMVNDFGDSEENKKSFLYMDENLLVEKSLLSNNDSIQIITWRITSKPVENGIEVVNYTDIYNYYNNQIAWEVNYSNGLKNGLSTGRYLNGNLKWIVNYKNGKKEGKDKRYYESGELKSSVKFVNGLEQEKKEKKLLLINKFLRREGDSNPRYALLRTTV